VEFGLDPLSEQMCTARFQRLAVRFGVRICLSGILRFEPLNRITQLLFYLQPTFAGGSESVHANVKDCPATDLSA
jgi:hypothetical protein